MRAVIASGSGLGKKIKGVIDAGQVLIQNTGIKLNRCSELFSIKLGTLFMTVDVLNL